MGCAYSARRNALISPSPPPLPPPQLQVLAVSGDPIHHPPPQDSRRYDQEHSKSTIKFLSKNPSMKPLWIHLADDENNNKDDIENDNDNDNDNDDEKPISIPTPVSTKPTRKVVLYVTSLRGIRRTHEDCSTVKNILRGLHVAVDERDLAMNAAFKAELHAAVKGKGLKGVCLPQLFVGGELVGGAEEVRRMHEEGELVKVLEGAARVEDPGWVCGGCGGVRFVPCEGCSGSRRVFVVEEGRRRWCGECNENGLVRCPSCCVV